MENKHMPDLHTDSKETDLESAATNEFPTEVEEALESIPEEQKKIIEEHLFSFMQMRSVSSPETEVMKKLTSEHITSYMDIMHDDMQNKYIEKRHNKIFSIIVLCLTMAFIITIVIILKSNPDIMEKVLYSAGGLIAGAIGGYGLGRKKTD